MFLTPHPTSFNHTLCAFVITAVSTSLTIKTAYRCRKKIISISHSELEQKLAEERAAKLRLENRILELEKHSSMMDCDYKQALQKLDELRRHKDRLNEEVSDCLNSLQGKQLSVCLHIK